MLATRVRFLKRTAPLWCAKSATLATLVCKQRHSGEPWCLCWRHVGHLRSFIITRHLVRAQAHGQGVALDADILFERSVKAECEVPHQRVPATLHLILSVRVKLIYLKNFVGRQPHEQSASPAPRRMRLVSTCSPVRKAHTHITTHSLTLSHPQDMRVSIKICRKQTCMYAYP